MGQLKYSGTYPDLYTFNDGRTKATLIKYITDAFPADGVLMAVIHEIYAGIDKSIRGQSVTASFTLTDADGNSATVVCTAIAPTQSPAYIRFVGHPGASNIDYNRLVRVKLGGTDKLVTRKDHECPLYINYRTPFEAYTDLEVIAGQTPIKAAHMLELWENINIMRQGYALPVHVHADIKAGYTSLGGWADHIQEMRAAIDEIGTSHEAWLTITENKPRADVIMQLRRVVAAL